MKHEVDFTPTTLTLKGIDVTKKLRLGFRNERKYQLLKVEFHWGSKTFNRFLEEFQEGESLKTNDSAFKYSERFF